MACGAYIKVTTYEYEARSSRLYSVLELIANVPPSRMVVLRGRRTACSGTWMVPALERQREQLAASPAHDASRPDY